MISIKLIDIHKCFFDSISKIIYKIMKNRTLWFWLYPILIYLVLSCSEKQSNNLSPLLVSENIDEQLKLVDFLSSIQHVELETNQNSFLTYIVDVKLENEHLYITDFSKNLLIFDLNGRFIKKISGLGDGPGQYEFFPSLVFDNTRRKIYIGSGYKILVFSSNHNYIYEIKFPFFINKLFLLDGNLCVISQQQAVKENTGFRYSTNLFKLDSEFNLIDTLEFRNVIMNSSNFSDYLHKDYISNFGDRTFIYTPIFGNELVLRDTLYEIIGDRFIPNSILGFKSYQEIIKGQKKIEIYNIINSKSYIIGEFDLGSNRIMYFFDKKNSIGYSLKKGFIDPERDTVFLRPLNLENNLFYYVKLNKLNVKGMEELNPIISLVELK